MSVKILFLKIFVLTSISVFHEVGALNILGVFPLPAKSHFFVFAPYLKELAERGHNLTIISYYPPKEPLDNYHHINLGKNSQEIEISHPINKSLFVVFISLTLLQAFGGSLTCRILLEDENVQDLWETNAKFDLVVMEQFNSDCGLALAHRLGAPVVGITSHVLLPWHYNRFGVPYNPSYVSYDFLEGGTKPTFVQRILRIILYNHINFVYHYASHGLEQMTVSEFLGDVPPLSELAKDIKLVLVYQNFILTGSHILPPNVIEVGGFHVDKPKPLPEDLKKFIEESEHGVIYISFGTMLKASTMPADKLINIISALEELPQRVVWKWNKNTLPGNPKNIYLSKWLPQNDILAHPNVVAFFSHCGLLGTTEAIYHGVPVVGMPIYGDQPTNAASIEESGLGVQIDLDLLTKESLLEKFSIILNPTFREKVKLLSKAWHDRPVKAMDNAIFWTEFAVRHQNLTLKPPIVEVPMYQYLCLDVYLVLLVFLIVTYIVCKYFALLLIKICFNKCVQINNSPHNNKVKVN